MKKLINGADTVLEESLDGFAAAHADILLLGAERKFVRRRELKHGKVALVSGGGSGHEPLHAGFVGHGMLDAACPGQVFTSPTPDQMVAAVEAVDTGNGCLFIVKNYEGDVMNFQMAADVAGKAVETVVTDDDVAVERSTWSTGRRGVAGSLVGEMIGAIVKDLTPPSGAEALLLVNGFGGTPAMELYLMVNSALRVLRGKGVRVTRYLTGSYVTSLDMAGCSITVSLLDDVQRKLWDAPVHTAALRWGT